MSGNTFVQWRGFEYEPVFGAFERAQRRITRAARKTMLRFFQERGFPAYAARTRDIRDNSSLNGEEKNDRFQRILNDYARETTQSATEAAHTVSEGAVGVPSA